MKTSTIIIACFFILICEIIYQRIKWKVSCMWYYRKYRKEQHKYVVKIESQSMPKLILICSSLLKNGAVLLSYQEVDFSKEPHRAIMVLNIEEIQKNDEIQKI